MIKSLTIVYVTARGLNPKIEWFRDSLIVRQGDYSNTKVIIVISRSFESSTRHYMDWIKTEYRLQPRSLQSGKGSIASPRKIGGQSVTLSIPG
jgi:hypothetical protein